MFSDRIDAGRALAGLLGRFRDADVVVVGLPRGGVPVAAEVARSLGAPLDVILVRKVGVPWQPELAMGAIGEDGVRVVNDEVMHGVGVSADDFADVERVERAELERRVTRFRAGRTAVPLAGRTVIVVDDGIATGSTARAACQVARAHGARQVVLAVPVAPHGWVDHLAGAADEYVAVDAPRWFGAVGAFYDDFTQVADDEVVSLLRRWGDVDAARPDGDERPPVGEIVVEAGPVRLAGLLEVPQHPVGTVVFAHGSGSSRHSPRNREVARVLQSAGFATLLFDLLTEGEERDRANVFDIALLGSRLIDVVAWVGRQPLLGTLPIGLFGASTGAGAALVAAADPNGDVAAVVSRGGRPDLAEGHLGAVRAPTLLIVGERDRTVLELNEFALARLGGPAQLATVPGATHLFEEPGALARVSELAAAWFGTHLVRSI